MVLQFEMSFPSKSFRFCSEASFGFLFSLTFISFVITPNFPFICFGILKNHLFHLLFSLNSIDSFFKILSAKSPLNSYKTLFFKFIIKLSNNLISHSFWNSHFLRYIACSNKKCICHNITSYLFEFHYFVQCIYELCCTHFISSFLYCQVKYFTSELFCILYISQMNCLWYNKISYKMIWKDMFYGKK